MKAFSSFHPSVLMTYFVCVTVITMLTQNPVMLVLSVLGAMLFIVTLEGAVSAFKSLGFYIPMFFLIAAFNPLFSHRGETPLFFMNGNPVTFEAVLYGLASGGMIVAVFYWFRCYNSIITSDKFVFLFGRALPKLSLVVSMALRFVPAFKKQIKKINDVQKTMGFYARDSIFDRLSGAMRIFFGMVTWSLENAADTAASMNARGYGIKGRTTFSLFEFKLRDGIMEAVIVILTVITFTGSTKYTFYPKLSQLPMTAISVVAYTALMLLVFIPTITEIREGLRWKYLISKI